MVLSLLFGKKYAQARVGTVFLDATLNEEHSYSSRITSFPIESGTTISDHIINEPERLQITGIVSDTPLSILSPFNRSIDAFNRLIAIHERKEIITVVTGIKVYVNMVMTSLQIPRNIQSGQSLSFVIELQKILLDSSVRLNLDQNNPFTRSGSRIYRDQVADASKYPFIQNDAVTSLKDQATSLVDVGIQDLQPIPNNILPNILNGITSLQGLV